MSEKGTASQSLKFMRISNYIVQPRLDEGPGICRGLPNVHFPPFPNALAKNVRGVCFCFLFLFSKNVKIK